MQINRKTYDRYTYINIDANVSALKKNYYTSSPILVGSEP